LHLHLTGSFSFFFPVPATPEIYTLSLHDALPICLRSALGLPAEEVWAAHLIAKHNLLETVREKTGLKFDPEVFTIGFARRETGRSEEHTSELQSRFDLVCRLLLEKKKHKNSTHIT